MEKYIIWIENKPIEVSKDVYKTYWSGRRKERYFAESDIHNNVFYYDALDTDETNGSDIFSDKSSLSVDETVINEIEYEHLHEAMTHLTNEEYNLIKRLYFYQESLRSIANQMGVSPSTLHYRHHKALEKLRQLME